MEDMIIRYESMGTIIWSKKYKCYYITNDKKNEKEIHNILKKNKKDGEIYNELVKMGLNGTKKEIFSKNEKGLMAPLEYYFDFTNVCNLKCSHCYNRNNMNTTTMDVDLIEKIIKDMYQNGVMRLHLAGGEPTLFPKEMEAYLGAAKKYGIMSSMATNGTVITDEICEIISNNNIFSITVSVEGADEERNARIRGEGSLEKSINGIKKLVKYKQKNNKSFNIGVKVSFDTDTTKEDFEKLIELALELKIDILKFANPERCLYHDRGHYSSIKDKYYENMKNIRELKNKYKDKIFITQISSPLNNCANIGIPNLKGCIGAQELIAINAKGNITPCLMNTYNLGNVKDYNSIADVYKSDKIKDYYNKVKDYECGDCSFHSKCRGGCQVRKIVEHGDIMKIDPLCPKELVKDSKELIKGENRKKEFKYFDKIAVLHSL